MNIKLKAFLLALVYVIMPFIFLYVTFVYPLLILFAAVGFIVFIVYNKILDDLTREHQKKNGYTSEEFNKEFGEQNE